MKKRNEMICNDKMKWKRTASLINELYPFLDRLAPLVVNEN